MSDTAILIVGAGAMGGTIGAHLVRSGHEVVFVDRAAEHVARMREAGLSVTRSSRAVHRTREGALTGRVQALHRVFPTFDERARLTDNIWGFLWSKEAYGALLFATALTARLTGLIHEIESGARPQGIGSLEALAEAAGGGITTSRGGM